MYKVLILIAGTLILCLISIGFWFLLDGWRLQHYEPAISIALLYRRLHRQGKILLITKRRGNTPNEFAASLRKIISHTARGNRWRDVLIPASGELDQLTDIYSRSMYSAQIPKDEDRIRAIQAWNRLGWRLFLAWLLRNIHRL